jgi:hypothetical protein
VETPVFQGVDTLFLLDIMTLAGEIQAKVYVFNIKPPNDSEET